eukprot:PhF_6_TR15095/c0_g1_i6/m.23754
MNSNDETSAIFRTKESMWVVPDMMYLVLDYLPATDFVHMSCVCKFLHQYISSEPLLWYRMVKRDYLPQLIAPPPDDVPCDVFCLMHRWLLIASPSTARRYNDFMGNTFLNRIMPSPWSPYIATTMMVEGGILERTLKLCQSPSSSHRYAKLVVNALRSLLWLGEQNPNVFRSHPCWESKGDGLIIVEELQRHENNDVYETSILLLERHFCEDDG